MLDFQQKRKVRSILYHRVTLGILILICLLTAHSTWSVYKKKQESEALRHEAQERLDALTTRNNELVANIARLKTSEGVEAEIRSKFSVVKSNENMVVIVNDDASVTVATTTSKGFWQRFKGWFGR